MKVHVLGCGDAFGSGGRRQSGYLVDTGDRLFLLDCGPSSLLAMKAAGFESTRLDAVFLSHLHGDHFGGLPFFFIEYLYQNKRIRPLHVAGPVGTEDKVRRLFNLMYGSGIKPKDLPPVRFHLLQPDKTVHVDHIPVFSFRVPHQVEEVSLALKIGYSEKHILFSGDSAWTDEFLIHGRDVDLFICECTYWERQTANHMNYLQLREKLTQLQCSRILLTHMSSEVLDRTAEIPYPTARDGMIVEV